MPTFASEKAATVASSSSQKPNIWQAALERYYDTLHKSGIKDSSVDKDLWNVEMSEDLLVAWNMALEKLSDEARTLQNILAFFDPDQILERLITDTKAELDDDKLQFLFEEFDFGDAVMELIRAALVTRIAASKALSIHPLLLYHDFPNTWAAKGPYQGHGYKSWETCSVVLVHIKWLMSLSQDHKVTPNSLDTWAELIFRAGTYLWEKEQPTLAHSFLEFGLSLNIDKNSVVAAQAFRLLGHISLDLARPRAALRAYQEALAAGQRIEKPDPPPIADVYDSIACSLTEIGDVVEATKYLERAMSIHMGHDPLKRGRTEAIRALTFLRAGDSERSLEALQTCWELQGLKQEEVEASDYPKNSGGYCSSVEDILDARRERPSPGANVPNYQHTKGALRPTWGTQGCGLDVPACAYAPGEGQARACCQASQWDHRHQRGRCGDARSFG
ncbi:hypothetical protein NPX13_g7632 [Xylaria arbuscula]|uniref:DUF7779 domain-containing protein n=1 Tax=Xylaria arbuscula TaxID=114810 RepID=A0A9W8N9Y6_9PEZI|nr:hypothetical protein NPX13_g7632 [Xylaria arbuscula]